MLKTYFSVVIALGFVTILTVTGCKSEEDFRIERANNARLHFEMAQFKELAQDTRLTLPECIRLAHENNLDAKVYKLEEAVAREMRTAEVLGMLPEININNNFTGVGSVGFPAATLIGMTWSKDLAYSFGDSIGKMANETATSTLSISTLH